MSQSFIQNVFVVPNGKTSEFLSLGKDVNYIVDGGLSRKPLVQHGNGQVGEIVERADVA